MVLPRCELDNKAKLLLNRSPEVVSAQLRRTVKMHMNGLVAKRARVQHNGTKERDPVVDGVRLDGLDVSVGGELANGDELVDRAIDQ